MIENEKLIYVKKHARLNKVNKIEDNNFLQRNSSSNSLSKQSLSSIDTSPKKSEIQKLYINPQKPINKLNFSRVNVSSNEEKDNESFIVNDKYSIKENKEIQMSLSNVSQLLNLFHEGINNDIENQIYTDNNNIIPEINTLYTPRYGFQEEINSVSIPKSNNVDNDTGRINNICPKVSSYNDVKSIPISTEKQETSINYNQKNPYNNSRNYSVNCRNLNSIENKNSLDKNHYFRTLSRTISSSQPLLSTQTDSKSNYIIINNRKKYSLKERKLNSERCNKRITKEDNKHSPSILRSLISNMMINSNKNMNKSNEDKIRLNRDKLLEKLKEKLIEKKDRKFDVKIVEKIVNLNNISEINLAPIPLTKKINHFNYDAEKQEYLLAKGNAVIKRRKIYSNDLKSKLKDRLNRDVSNLVFWLKYEKELRKIQLWWKKISKNRRVFLHKIIKIQTLVRRLSARIKLRNKKNILMTERINNILSRNLNKRKQEFFKYLLKINEILEKIVLIQSVFRSYYYKYFILINELPILKFLVNNPNNFIIKYYGIKYILKEFYKKLQSKVYRKRMKKKISFLIKTLKFQLRKRNYKELLYNIDLIQNRKILIKNFLVILNWIHLNSNIRKFYLNLSKIRKKHIKKITIINLGMKSLLKKVLFEPFIQKLKSYKTILRRNVISKIVLLFNRIVKNKVFQRIKSLIFIKDKWNKLMKLKCIYFDQKHKKKFFNKLIRIINHVHKNSMISISKGLYTISNLFHFKIRNLIFKSIIHKTFKILKLMKLKMKKEHVVSQYSFHNLRKITLRLKLLDKLRLMKLKYIVFNLEKRKLFLKKKSFKKVFHCTHIYSIKNKYLFTKGGFLLLINLLSESIRYSFKIIQKTCHYTRVLSYCFKIIDKKIYFSNIQLVFSILKEKFVLNHLLRRCKLFKLKQRVIYLENTYFHRKFQLFSIWKEISNCKVIQSKSHLQSRLGNKIKRYVDKLKIKKKNYLLRKILNLKISFLHKKLASAVNFWRNKDIIIYKLKHLKYLFNCSFHLKKINLITILNFILRNCNPSNLFTQYIITVVRKHYLKYFFNKFLYVYQQKLIDNKIWKILSLPRKLRVIFSKKDKKMLLVVQKMLLKWAQINNKQNLIQASELLADYIFSIKEKKNLEKFIYRVNLIYIRKYQKMKDQLYKLFNIWYTISKCLPDFDISVNEIKSIIKPQSFPLNIKVFIARIYTKLIIRCLHKIYNNRKI